MFGDNTQQVVDNGMAMPANDQGYGQPMSDQPAPMYPTDSGAPAPMVAQDDMGQQGAVDPSQDHELLTIKQDALNSLTPLVAHLDQSPEEKFSTTMMLIQASDDRNLVKVAYEAAQAIADDKVRAQALLDVINEINYFTSHSA